MASTSSPTRPADHHDAGAPRSPDWSFARRPFWLFSHVFALAVVVLFVNLGLWQLSRHDERQAANDSIAERVALQPVEVGAAGDVDGDPAELDYRPVVVRGTFVDDDFVRVVNRSQGGVAGEHIVGVMELADGSLLAVNRGFVPANADPELRPSPAGPTMVTGWLRQTIVKGRFGADDSGEGNLIPRLNTDDLSARLDRDLPGVWLQADTEGTSATGDSADSAGDGDEAGGRRFPDPVPLPELDDGPHLGYAAQWFVFATLGVLFYGALLRRQSRTT